MNHLTTGGVDDPFLPQLIAAINAAAEIELAVSFIKQTGLRLLFPALEEALTERKCRLRIITSDYLDITDPEALAMLMLLKERDADVRVYASAGQSFHMKAYIVVRSARDRPLEGCAFIGSSNISRSALTDGLEWNYRIDCHGADLEARRKLTEIRDKFTALFHSPGTLALEHAWIEAYRRRRRQLPQPVAPGSHEVEPPPVPTAVQTEALAALQASRDEGYRRGLVVMATGLGKTWLAAFDSVECKARRVLFVAHREEILLQAEKTFLRIRPKARVGYYTGQSKDEGMDILCASIQTLGQPTHLARFAADHFDYVVVDEFHHAAAATYRRLLGHLRPGFLLGLTATPERTDQSDILSLCDDNLVYSCNLFNGVTAELLVPFSYYGIFDQSVDYQAIPWRNSRFDPALLSNKLATLARARHALAQWRDKAQTRTLAFCASIKHADFMAEQFGRAGIRAAAVYAGSLMSRTEALERLAAHTLQVIFSVDLFNEGVDLPSIDTVMMLRPTESKVLFLQQLGRGLRRAEGKQRLVVLDFIGNHQGFFNKPQALFDVGPTHRELAAFARKLEAGQLSLPDGCFITYDLQLVEFLKQLDQDGPVTEYEALKAAMGRRPTLTEYYRAGINLARMRQQFGSWWQLVDEQGDLEPAQVHCLARQQAFLREVETTAMVKSFKMVLLESLLEHDGFLTPPSLSDLACQAFGIFARRRTLLADLKPEWRDLGRVEAGQWQRYWSGNPVRAWLGGNRTPARNWFVLRGGRFCADFPLSRDEWPVFAELLQELVDYRLAAYEPRLSREQDDSGKVLPRPTRDTGTVLPFFPNIRIACGHFRTGQADAEEYLHLGPWYGRLDPQRHFIARAAGNSMAGGKQPVHDGDYLLLERVTATRAGSISGQTMAIERLDEAGDGQYLLRVVHKNPDGSYRLQANNPDYPDLPASEEMHTFARLKAILDPLELAVGQSFMREAIPALFGVAFNPGNWNSGHVVLNAQHAHVLLVTLNKQGQAEAHRYQDFFRDDEHFHWQSQNQTGPEDKRGQALIQHARLGIAVHLFVRDARLAAGKAAPFIYHGQVEYLSHQGSRPMSIEWRLQRPRDQG